MTISTTEEEMDEVEMGNTKIPYADKSWNVTVGCTPTAIGCQSCWARELHDKRHKAFLAGRKVPVQYAKPFETIQLRPDRLDEPLRCRKPTRFFVCSMSDLFHKDVPIELICRVYDVMRQCPRHVFFLLTKRVERMKIVHSGLNVLDNVWLGISCSTQADLDRMAPILFEIPATAYVCQCPQDNVSVYVKQLDVGGKIVTEMEDFPADMRIKEIPTRL